MDKFSSSERFVYLQSWTKVLGHFCVSGAFSDSHQPKTSPHPTNNVGRTYLEFFSEFQLRMGWREGELQENFEKDSPHCLMREPRMTEKYEYCSTVPGTTVHDCSCSHGNTLRKFRRLAVLKFERPKRGPIFSQRDVNTITISFLYSKGVS